jgi:hypothetical protein
MKPTKRFLHNLCVIAFVYVVLCPAVHQVADSVYHNNIIITSESRIQHRECPNKIDSSPEQAFTSLPISYPDNILSLINTAIPHSPFNLFRLHDLSTVRLNL